LIKKYWEKIKNIFKKLSMQDSELENRVLKCEKEIEFMSVIIAEQSRLLASVALVQSDMAKTLEGESVESSSGDIYLKISAEDDEFIN